MKKHSQFSLNRRDFLRAAAATSVAVGGSSLLRAQPASQSARSASPNENITLADVGSIPADKERTWIGSEFWGNRLQDWRIADGRIECVSDKKERDLCTVSLLTHELIAGAKPASLSVRTGSIGSRESRGFSGFLVGAGSGKLDYRGAALVQRGSGIGGGIMCVYTPGVGVEFREHTDEKEPVLWAPLQWDTIEPEAQIEPDTGIDLRLDIAPAEGGEFDLHLTASQSGRIVSGGIMRGVPEADIMGGVMLVSAALLKPFDARFWFSDVKTGGEKIARNDERAMGPIVGALYTLNGSVLKMTAQLMPIGNEDSQDVKLQVLEAGTDEWTDRATARVGKGFNALFRVADWDASKDWEYRVVHGDGTSGHGATYEGIIQKDPVDNDNLKIGLYSCTITTNRLLDRGVGGRLPSWARFLGRYTPECVVFPYNELVKHGSHHEPDLLFFVGDQFYEDHPSVRDTDPNPLLDYVYKWVLWVWGFREMTRNIPTVVLTDDHDVFQPNLFGNGGRPAPDEQYNHGGYRSAAEWVNMVQRTQCGHNPDPYDPQPVDQGISVYYCTFKYGGVDFAALEDRKWKTAPWQGHSLDVHEAVLLGDRQEKMLEEWGSSFKDSDDPRIVATQTIFACVQTMENGRPMLDFDANSYPPLARRRAIELIRDAGALMISGDQHLATVIRNGVEEHDDGPVQFTGPAGAATWTRWFQPAEPLENARDTKYTGDFIDAFGNKCHVMAVANPEKISMAEYRADVKPPTQYIGDRDLKAEGYGIINVDKANRQYVLECWRWDVDPSAPGAKQFAGWPVSVSFEEAGRARKS